MHVHTHTIHTCTHTIHTCTHYSHMHTHYSHLHIYTHTQPAADPLASEPEACYTARLETAGLQASAPEHPSAPVQSSLTPPARPGAAVAGVTVDERRRPLHHAAGPPDTREALTEALSPAQDSQGGARPSLLA